MEVTLGEIVAFLFLVFLVLLVLVIWSSFRSSAKLESARTTVIQSIEKKRGSRVIVMIHRHCVRHIRTHAM